MKLQEVFPINMGLDASGGAFSDCHVIYAAYLQMIGFRLSSVNFSLEHCKNVR